MKRQDLGRTRRMVVKVGTSLLAPPRGGVHARRFADLAREISALMDRRIQVVLVSSGAVGLGLRRLERNERPRSIPEKQAAAAIGQIDLCRRYERAFARHGRLVGQILLTHGGLADRERFLNARHTMTALLADGVVPIINENDSVATEELRFGDNDRLGALVVNVCRADLFVMLTDTDGLHDRHPEEPGARRIPDVEEVTPRILRLASGAGTKLATGGMRSKLEAARMASRFGVPSIIARGARRDVLQRIVAAEDIGTLVWPAVQRLKARKHWIAFSNTVRGTLRLDEGAVRAILQRGGSLLPIGVVGIEGRFGIGDLVRCVGPDGEEVARGLISYDATEIERIMGQRTARIADLLGYSNGDEVIHRDDLTLV